MSLDAKDCCTLVGLLCIYRNGCSSKVWLYLISKDAEGVAPFKASYTIKVSELVWYYYPEPIITSRIQILFTTLLDSVEFFGQLQ